MTLVDNYTALGYNVTAVAQTSGTSGTGPGYLLNGYSNTGYWYQVGLSWNWETFYGYSPNNFLLSYEVFSPNGTSIYPTGGGTGLLTLSGPVNEGDIVLLNLYFKNNSVVFLVKDWNTGATGSTTFPAYGADKFVGNPYSTSTDGFFTGLMTEWYSTDSSFPIQQPVTYSPYGAITSPAWLWADEFYCSQPCYQKSGITSNVSSTYYYPTSPHYLTLSPGSTVEYTDDAVFVTGATPPAPFYLASSNVKTVQIDNGTFLKNAVNVSVIGGTPPYTYSLNINNFPWEILEPTDNTTGRLSYSPFGEQSIGTYYYNVTVTDNDGNKVTTPQGELIVEPDPQIILNAQKTTIDAGQALSTDYNITGGSAPFNISYFLNGQDIGSTLTIPNAGNYSLYARVTDADGKEANSSQISFVVNHAPNINVSQSRTSTDVGTPLTLVASGSSGTQPYSYSWYVNKQPVSSGSTYMFSENQAGTYVVYASLTDGAGDVINSSQTTFTVNTKPSISTLKVIPTSSSFLYLNNSASGTVSVSGGEQPIGYKWYVNGVLQPNSNSSAYILGPLGTGMNNVSVTAIDADGNRAQDSFLVTTSYNTGIIVGIIAAIVVVGGALVYLFVLRKPKGVSN